MLPILAGGTVVRRCWLGRAEAFPSCGVCPEAGVAETARPEALQMFDAPLRHWLPLAMMFSRRTISLLTRLSAATDTCLRSNERSAVPGKLAPRGAPLPRISRRFARACVCSLIAQITQAVAQILQIIERCVIDGRVMARKHRFQFRCLRRLVSDLLGTDMIVLQGCLRSIPFVSSFDALDVVLHSPVGL